LLKSTLPVLHQALLGSGTAISALVVQQARRLRPIVEEVGVVEHQLNAKPLICSST
jgi:hypothetical protein